MTPTTRERILAVLRERLEPNPGVIALEDLFKVSTVADVTRKSRAARELFEEVLTELDR